MKPRVFFLFEKKEFHYLPLVGTRGGANPFHQAPKTFSSSLSIPFSVPLRSAELISKKARNTSWFHPSDSHSPSSWNPSHHPLSSPPSPTLQRSGLHLPDTPAAHPQSAQPSRLLVSKQNSYFVLVFTFVPCLPNTLRAMLGRALFPLTHSQMLCLRVCTGASPPSLFPQHLHGRQRKYRHSFVLSSPPNYNYPKIPRDSRKLGFIWYLQ